MSRCQGASAKSPSTISLSSGSAIGTAFAAAHDVTDEGQWIDVLERANRSIVGRLYEEHGIGFVVAENRRINQDLLVPPGDRGKAKPGDVVVVEIVEQPSSQR